MGNSLENTKNKSGFIQGIKDQFSTKTLVLIPIAVGINLVGGVLASTLKLPLFMDMIGTIIAASLGGPWVAALVGLLTNVFLALVANPIYLPYALVNVSSGLVAGFFIRKGFFKGWKTIIMVLGTSLVSAITASLVTVIGFGGATGVTGTSVITAAVIAATENIVKSVFATSFIENLVDRAIAFAIAYVVMKKIPKRFRSQYSLDTTDEDFDFDKELEV